MEKLSFSLKTRMDDFSQIWMAGLHQTNMPRFSLNCNNCKVDIHALINICCKSPPCSVVFDMYIVDK